MLNDTTPKKITLSQWSELFTDIDNDTIREYKYFHNSTWGLYLQPPVTFMVYGARELKRLKFDNSFSSLRMWGFVFNESERLFRARQAGKKIIATMGDLGTVPVIIMAFPDCIPFYPECIWWTPFFNESTVLLDIASDLGAPEAACFSRAALAAFYKKAYFPKPDLIFGSTGATCDDFSGVIQLLEHIGYDIIWLEIPHRPFLNRYHSTDKVVRTAEGYEYPRRFLEYLIHEYKKVWHHMSELTGIKDESLLLASIKKTNRLRSLVSAIKELWSQAEIAPYPALEMMTIEFGNLYGYADIDEWLSVLEMIHKTMKTRAENNIGILPKNAVPIAWVSPSADPYLLNFVEDVGLRVVASEYVINQALVEIDGTIDPFEALARSFMEASLIGSTSQRIRAVKEAVRAGKVKGVLITNVLGGSHCAMETRAIERALKGVPVLTLDVPPPFGITEQMKTRIEAFSETLHG